MKPLTERKFIKECMSLVREFTQKRKVCLKKKHVLHGSVDVEGTSQLAIFVRGINLLQQGN